jgi:hypothetical protein
MADPRFKEVAQQARSEQVRGPVEDYAQRGLKSVVTEETDERGRPVQVHNFAWLGGSPQAEQARPKEGQRRVQWGDTYVDTYAPPEQIREIERMRGQELDPRPGYRASAEDYLRLRLQQWPKEGAADRWIADEANQWTGSPLAYEHTFTDEGWDYGDEGGSPVDYGAPATDGKGNIVTGWYQVQTPLGPVLTSADPDYIERIVDQMQEMKHDQQALQVLYDTLDLWSEGGQPQGTYSEEGHFTRHSGSQ